MISENDKIAPGVLKLQSASRPPLVAGQYEVKSNITLKNVISGGKDAGYQNNTLSFIVAAPRFSLDLALIYGTYPLAGSTGAYHTSLPHIVLGRKTLPWERTIDTEANKNPWMCLLLLTDEEIARHHVQNRKISIDAVTNNGGDNNLIVPQLASESWAKQGPNQKSGEAEIMELPLLLYNRISPKAQELSSLVHSRQVDTTDKEDTTTNPKGWYAVVVGNRLPQAGKNNNVFLVSLEGHPDAQKNDPNAQQKRIRMVVLHKWSFTESGATFEEIADTLLKTTGPLRIEPATDRPLAETTKKALRFGYMPLSHELRNGQQQSSWYRGPLVPVDVAYPQLYQYQSADQALRFDPKTGFFDISYAAAWQLGRLLALKSPGYFKALSEWKMSFQKEQIKNTATAILSDPEVGINIAPSELTAMAHDAVSDEIITDFLIELWNKP